MQYLMNLPKTLWVAVCQIDGESAVATVRAKTLDSHQINCALLFSSKELAELGLEELGITGTVKEMPKILPTRLIETGLQYACLDFIAGKRIGILSLSTLAQLLDSQLADTHE